jgi:hypothetical protein
MSSQDNQGSDVKNKSKTTDTPSSNYYNTPLFKRRGGVFYILSGLFFVTGFIVVVPALLGATKVLYIVSGSLVMTGLTILMIACCVTEDPLDSPDRLGKPDTGIRRVLNASRAEKGLSTLTPVTLEGTNSATVDRRISKNNSLHPENMTPILVTPQSSLDLETEILADLSPVNFDNLSQLDQDVLSQDHCRGNEKRSCGGSVAERLPSIDPLRPLSSESLEKQQSHREFSGDSHKATNSMKYPDKRAVDNSFAAFGMIADTTSKSSPRTSSPITQKVLKKSESTESSCISISTPAILPKVST